MKKSVLFSLALMLILPSLCFASVAVIDDGTYEGEAMSIDFTGTSVTFDGSKATVAAVNANSVVSTATKTITAAENNSIFVTTRTGGGAVAFTLPTAAANLKYIIAAGATNAITVDPASTADTIKYLTLDAGDKIASNSATGDSVTLLGAASTWYVIDTGSSAWTDGGA